MTRDPASVDRRIGPDGEEKIILIVQAGPTERETRKRLEDAVLNYGELEGHLSGVEVQIPHGLNTPALRRAVNRIVAEVMG